MRRLCWQGETPFAALRGYLPLPPHDLMHGWHDCCVNANRSVSNIFAVACCGLRYCHLARRRRGMAAAGAAKLPQVRLGCCGCGEAAADAAWLLRMRRSCRGAAWLLRMRRSCCGCGEAAAEAACLAGTVRRLRNQLKMGRMKKEVDLL
jgi:hypothetical protein